MLQFFSSLDVYPRILIGVFTICYTQTLKTLEPSLVPIRLLMFQACLAKPVCFQSFPVIGSQVGFAFKQFAVLDCQIGLTDCNGNAQCKIVFLKLKDLKLKRALLTVLINFFYKLRHRFEGLICSLNNLANNLSISYCGAFVH